MTEHQEQEVTIKELLEAGAHFGHQTRRWNPKMKRYIFEARNGIYIINLAKTLQQIRDAVKVITQVVEKHQSILFVGTKKQAKQVVREFAELSGEFYVSERWLGGMLTNLHTIRQSVRKLDRIEKKIASGTDSMTKKELILLSKDQEKLDRNLSGVRAMRKVPGLVVVVDPSKEHLAVAEARKLGIPVMGLVDTNCDPDLVDHVIACNDDALKSIRLILQALAYAVIKRKQEMNILVGKSEGSSSGYTEEAFEEKAKAEDEEAVPAVSKEEA